MQRWAIRIGTTDFPVDDLPINKIQSIATTFGISWMSLVQFPCTHAIAYIHLLGVVCELHPEVGAVELGDVSSSARAVLALTEMCVPIEDDLPNQWVDGAPLEGEPATTG